MAVFSIQCPECNAVLKSSKPVPAGKQVTCPKCDVMFTAAAPRPAKPMVEEVEVIEDDYDAVEIIDDSPAKKPAAVAVKPKRKRPRQEFRKKKNPWPLILGITGGILGVALLAIGGYFGFKFITTSRSGDPLAYAPENVGMTFGADLGQLVNSSQFGPMIEPLFNALPPLAQYKQGTGIDYKSAVDKIVVSVGSAQGAAQGTVSVALTSKTNLDKDKLAEAFGVKPATVGGRNIFAQQAGPYQKQALMVPTANLAAFYMGSPNSLDDAVRQGGRSMPKPDVEKMMKKAAAGHVWAVMDLSVPGMRDTSNLGPMATPGMRDLMNNMTVIGMWANLSGSDLEIHQHMLAPTPDAAKALMEQMQKEAKSQKGNMMMQAMTMAMGGAGVQKDVQDSEKYEIDGSTVIYTAKVKLDNMKTLVDRMSTLGNMMPGLPGGAPDPRGGRPGGR